ncbi:MAG: hypothetical protein KAV00_04360 [Phycisphaerae bacterium]|nr:hypothetical protein [Phycisphaerae bacterium]
MKRLDDFDCFVQAVAKLPLSVADKAIACLWYAIHYEPGCERTVSELANLLHQTGLAGTVNNSRLGNNLRASQYTVQGKKRNSFRISVVRRPELDKRYLSLLRSPHVEVDDSILPKQLMKGTKPYLEQLAHQINGCYQFHFYDACAVLCRRMVESLLIEAFDKIGHLAAIQDANGNLVGLDEIVGQARSGRYIKLGRTTPMNLEKVKEIGDTAAHDRYHLTTEQDIAEFRSGFRKVISELLTLAGIDQES